MKNKIVLYLCIAIFGVLGIYLTFIAGNTSKFDSQTEAYRIYPNESYDSDDNTIYRPIYYFRVDGHEYECMAKTGSSSYPKESKNIVYYEAKNPVNCKTEYEKSSSKLGGIVCLIATAIMVYFFIIKKPSESSYDFNQTSSLDDDYQMDEKTEKIIEVVDKIQLIYKRVILGIIIIVLLVFTLIDTAIVKQTIISKDYPTVTAVYTDKKSDSSSSVFEDYIYAFTDKKGERQEIIVSIPKDDTPNEAIKIKYNEKDPQDYYMEGATMDKSGIIWYVVKIAALVLLIILFFNKKLLSKINVSASG